MDDMEEKLNAVLSNPQMMQQIMSLAQSIGGSKSGEASPQEPASSLPFDMGMLQKITGIARQSGIDKNQQSLLQALRPYLSRDRIGKLEKAMRAAKVARMTSGLIGSGGLQLQSGR